MVVIYGVNPIKEVLVTRRDEVVKILLGRGVRGESAAGIISMAAKLKVPVERVDSSELTKVTGTAKHQGVAAVLRRGFSYSSLEEILVRVEKGRKLGKRAFVLVLDSIKDPGNLGSLIRTASCAGAQGLIIPKDRACPVTAVVEKASAGAVSHIPVARVTNIARTVRELKEEGLWAVAIEADGECDIYAADLSGDLAIVVGSESGGVRRLVREACDQCLSIPMAGPMGSLNAAQAGAIALFEAVRQGKKTVRGRSSS